MLRRSGLPRRHRNLNRFGWMRGVFAFSGMVAMLSTTSVQAIELESANVFISPNPIPCGGSANVNLQLTFKLSAGEKSGAATGGFTVWMFEDDFFSADDDLGTEGDITAGVNVLPDGTFTGEVNLTLNCAPKDGDGHCTLSGNFGSDDEFGSHDIAFDIYFTSFQKGMTTFTTTTFEVSCENTSGTTSISEDAGEPSGTATVEGTLTPIDPVANLNWGITYDQTQLTPGVVQFSPSAQANFQTTQVETTTPGVIRFIADNPSNVPSLTFDDPLWTAEFLVDVGAAFNHHVIPTTSDSTFFDQTPTPLNMTLGSGRISILPSDTSDPIVNENLIMLDYANQRIFGAPGTVTHPNLGIPDCSAAIATTYTCKHDDGRGRVEIDPGGGFDIPIIPIEPLPPLDFPLMPFKPKFQLCLGMYTFHGIKYVYVDHCPSESFDSYPSGGKIAGAAQLHGQAGWKGWDGNVGGSAPVTQAQSLSGLQSVQIDGAADLVHEMCTGGVGHWSFSSWQYIPSDFDSGGAKDFRGSHFVLMNSYEDGQPHPNSIFSVVIQADSDDSNLKIYYGDGVNSVDIPYETDRWVKIEAIVDLENDWTNIYYDDNLITEYQWTGGVFGEGVGTLDIAAVNLWANGSSPIFYDDMLLEEIDPCPADLNRSGAVNVDDLLIQIGDWGPCPAAPAPCPSDIVPPGPGNSDVNVNDLLDLIGQWGPCP